MAESQILRLGCAGLVADPGPFSGVPDGAMVEAQNVTYRRPGAVESRDSFVLTDDSALSSSSTPYGVHVFDDGSTQAVHWCGDSGAGAIWRKDGTTTIGGGFSFAQYKSHHASYRGRGLFTAQQGVAVLDTNSDTTARLAGVPRGPGFYTYVTASAGAWLKTGYTTAYRTVVARSLNGIISRGAPSETRIVANGGSFVSASDLYVTLRIYITPDIVAGDHIELYRAPYTAGTVNGYYLDGAPSDEGRLRASFRVTASDISTGYIDHADYASDSQFDGPYLYTNASQEGILLANERPNYARDVALYNSMMFYAGQRSPQRVTLNALSVGLPNDTNVLWTSGTDMSRRLCGGVVSASITSGSTTLTLTSAATDLQYLAVGQYITIGTGTGDDPETGNASLPANTQIVSINSGAGTAVMSNPAGATGAVVARLYDWIEVDDGTKRRIYTTADNAGTYPPRANILSTFTNLWIGRNEWNGYYSGFTGTEYTGGSADIERAWAASYGTASYRLSAVAAGPTNNESVTIRIERTDASLGSFTVRSSKPLAFDQYVDSVTGVTSSQEGTPGRLAWSKPFEPEAVPLPYYADVGDPNAPIYRIVPTQDALYILKGDGIFRAYGDTPENLVIQPVDPTARLNDYSPNMVTRYGPCVYAWTTRGIVEVGTGGVRNVDGAVYNQANFPVGERFNTTDGWAYSSQVGRVVVFGYRTDRWATGQNIWVYHPELGTWATWTFRRSIYAASSVSGGTVSGSPYPTIAFARGFAQSSIIGNVTSGSLSPVYKGGDAMTITPSVVSGTSIQIPAGTLWTPAVGDAIYNAAQQKTAWVTAVSSATAFTIDRDIGLFAATPYTVFEACESRVTWTASAAGNPGAEKHFVDSILLFTFLRYGRTFTERFQGYRNPTVVTNDVTYDSAATDYQLGKPYARRGHVPYGPGRDWALRFGFSQTQGGAYFSLDGAALSYSMTGSRL